MRIDYSDVTKQLEQIFYELVFAGLVDVLHTWGATSEQELLNAEPDALSEALRTGRVQYASGVFSGDFNSKITLRLRAMGAKKDKRTGNYRLAAEKVPSWVSAYAGAQKARAKDLHDAMQRKLSEMQRALPGKLGQARVQPEKVLGQVETGFQTTARKMEIPAHISTDSRARLAKDYSDNMELWIKDWTEKEITDLRKDVEANAEQGYRFDTLRKRIEYRYGTSKNKAKFLARQETALFTSKFRRERFAESGVKKYRWSTAHDERVRSSHKDLNGRIFSYDDPPIVDPRTGRRANPGEDFGCRCVDVPLVGSTVDAETVAA